MAPFPFHLTVLQAISVVNIVSFALPVRSLAHYTWVTHEPLVQVSLQEQGGIVDV